MNFADLYRKLELDLYRKLEFEAGFNEPIQLQSKNLILRACLFLSEVLGKLPFNKYTKNYYTYRVNERIIEVPWLFQNINLPKGSKILDFGCNRSKVSIELASLGYKVIGVDLLPYHYSHKNFEFIQGDFLQISLPSNSFDAVIAISTIEHCGLPYYGSPCPDGDKKAMSKIWEVLKHGGLAIITVPYATEFSKNNATRIYDEKTLKDLLSNFVIVREEYGLRNEQCSDWVICTRLQLPQIIGRNDHAVACLVCLKE
jgi:SAM-dependent methyltransferase